MDPSLTDTRTGFALINLDAGAIDSAFSLPAEADPASATQYAGYALMGVNRDGDTLTSQMQFRAASFTSRSRSHPYNRNDSLAGAYLYFRASDTTAKTEGMITVYESDTLTGISPVNRDGLKAPDDEIENGEAWTGEFKLDGVIDSVRLPDELAVQIFDARVSSDSSDAHAFAFRVVDYHGPARRTQAPYVILHVAKDNKVVRDSITGLTRFTAFENIAAAGRAAHPYSSQHTQRTAVFRINVGKILDTLETLNMAGARGELINAVTTAKRNPETEDCEAGGCADMGEFGYLTSFNPGGFRMFALDTLLTNEYPADSAAAISQQSLNGRFSAASSITPVSPHNVFSIKPALRSVIEKQSGGRTADPYIYIYLRPVAENSMILWDKPPKTETIFTPSRSQ
jgi:hypothetical protein